MKNIQNLRFEIKTIFNCPHCLTENCFKKETSHDLNLLVNYGDIYDTECVLCGEKIKVRYK